MPISRRCPEERCRQLRFFGSTGDQPYTKGHPRCERCKGTGVVTDDVTAQRVPFDRMMIGGSGGHLDRFRDFEPPDLIIPRR